MSSNNKKNRNEKKRILIVDDETDIANLVRKGLVAKGFYVDSYTDPLSALRDFKPSSYDLILLDIKMPNIDGFEVYKLIRKIDTKIKICFLTAVEIFNIEIENKLSELEPTIKNAGDYKSCIIRKPLGIKELSKLIGDLLA